MNYVVNMLAKPQKIKTTQMSSTLDVDSGMDIYLKNSYVCLNSVKHYNPDVVCMLVCSFNLTKEWEKRFQDSGICIKRVEFGGFQIDKSFNWDIVQYRYDVMLYLINSLELTDCVIMLDTDVVCTGSLDNAFHEVNTRLLLFDVAHDLQQRDRLNIIKNYQSLFPGLESYNLIHYGGEFIGSNIANLKKLFLQAKSIIEKSNLGAELVNFNDEHITSISVDLLCGGGETVVNNANAYIYRYWTNTNFYLVSSNWFYNPVVLWHLPFEKDKGFLQLYNDMQKGKYINKNKMAKIFGLPGYKRYHKLYYFIIRAKKKLGLF